MLSENKQTIFVICVLFAIAGAFMPSHTVCHPHHHDSDAQNVTELRIACMAFAIEHDGKFPQSLDELYPLFVESDQILKFLDHRTKESKPYTYFPNQTNTSDSGAPLVASPVIKTEEYDFRIVGYVGGHVLQVREDEYRKMITK